MKNIDFNDLAKEAYESAKERGFHTEKHTDGHWFMLVVCELAEAVEADRKGRWVEDRKEYERLKGICDEDVHAHLFEIHIKDTVEDEMADAVIRLLDYAGMNGVDIGKRMNEVFDDEEFEDYKGYETLKKDDRLFTEKVYEIIQAFMFDSYIEFFLIDIFELARSYNIDLMWFIREKLEYNKQRAYLHGKAY